jgi:hypothetical protein
MSAKEFGGCACWRVMRRPRRDSFENGFPRAEIAPWEQMLGRIPYEKPAGPGWRAEPLPRAFCVFFVVLSSLLIYGALFSLLGLLN